MALSNEDVQEIKEIVLETITEESDPIEDVQQVSELSDGDEVPIVRSSQGVNSYGRAPVNLFGGGGGGEPSQYIKDASVSQDGNTLTLTKKNNSTVTFTPDGGYNPPVGGIPKSDLASDVQASLENADNAVQQVKIGNNGVPIGPLNGTVTIPNYTENATPHIAPTSAEVKSALGTGSGTTKYLREDGTWQVPDYADVQEYINVEATAQTTAVTQVLPTTGSASIIYRVGKWDGTQYDATMYSEYSWNGSSYVHLSTREYGIDKTPQIGSKNLAESGGIFGVFKTLKTTSYIGNIGYSILPTKRGELYRAYNNGSFCSLYLKNIPIDGQGEVQAVSTSIANGSEIFFRPTNDWMYVYSYTSGTLDLQIQNITEENKSELDRKRANDVIDKVAFQNNGYIGLDGQIHSSTASKYTDKIYVPSGSTIEVIGDYRSDGVAVISEELNGQPFNVLMQGSQQSEFKDEEFTKVIYRYSVENETFVRLCASYYQEAYIYYNTNSFEKSDVLNKKRFFYINGDYSYSVKLNKGRKYIVRSLINRNFSCFTRYTSDGDIIDRVISVPQTDGSSPTLMEGLGYCIFTASEDANFITGYCNGVCRFSIEDFSSIEYELNSKVNQSLYPVVSYQSREGRVNSAAMPHNSKWAILCAAENQYDRIRLTVQRTTDGVYFCLHDVNINGHARNSDGSAISSSINASSQTIATLDSYDWGIQYGELYAGYKTPRLEESLYYISLCNLSVTLELRISSISNTDIDNIHKMLAKYNLCENCLIYSEDSNWKQTLRKFVEKDERLCPIWYGTYEQFDADLTSVIIPLKTNYNKVYIGFGPFGTIASDAYIHKIAQNGLYYQYGNIFKEADLTSVIAAHGISIYECANIALVKYVVYEHIKKNI